MANEKRLIDANALADRVDESKYNNPHPQGMVRVNHRNEHDHFLRMILDAPTVDAVEVVHARWIDVRQYCGDYMCSNCKELSRTKTYNYCPGCGADMKENKLNLEDVFDIEAQTKANNDAMRKAISFMVSGAKMDGGNEDG